MKYYYEPGQNYDEFIVLDKEEVEVEKQRDEENSFFSYMSETKRKRCPKGTLEFETKCLYFREIGFRTDNIFFD
jgi:hypothetical protein